MNSSRIKRIIKRIEEIEKTLQHLRSDLLLELQFAEVSEELDENPVDERTVLAHMCGFVDVSEVK